MFRKRKKKEWPEYIRNFRKETKTTQAMLAKYLGVSKRCVENWEGGINCPPAYLELAIKQLKFEGI